MAFLVNTYIIDDHADNLDSADILPGKQSRCSSVNNGDSGGVQVYERCVWRFLWRCSLTKIMIDEIHGDILPGQ